MGIGVSNKFGEGLSFKRGAWSEILDLALDFGWEPKGTLAPSQITENEIWDVKDYFSNCGQGVQESDASELASALERAIQALKLLENVHEPLPDEATIEEQFKEYERMMETGFVDDRAKLEPYFYEDEVKAIQDFVKFCMRGEFCIC